ncbi:serine/threonine-protein kinase, partial [Streptomyces calidiresistens]|uniref:serine/threonine-protein kinase n=1 Tax=Streptomyces calidiresistens TaxID=1485586 RepID=UPI001E5042E8
MAGAEDPRERVTPEDRDDRDDRLTLPEADGPGTAGHREDTRDEGWVVPGYTPGRELGSGASGRVVLAAHVATGEPVAVKYLEPTLGRDPRFREAFRTEARLLADLESPHVTALYEYVETTRGDAAIVMEPVPGASLRSLLRREGPVGPEAALTVLRGSLLGLAAAHATGMVHRDYKPENVLVTPAGVSKLVDFGIAARRPGPPPGADPATEHPGGPGRFGEPDGAAGSHGPGGPGTVSGTPAYMAPEQWRGEPAAPSGDVYAATATCYECLTGGPPFTGANIAELALRHTTAEVPLEPVPEPLRELIGRGLAKTPDARPADAAAFLRELEEVAGATYGPTASSNWRAGSSRRSTGGAPRRCGGSASTATAPSRGRWRSTGGVRRTGGTAGGATPRAR